MDNEINSPEFADTKPDAEAVAPAEPDWDDLLQKAQASGQVTPDLIRAACIVNGDNARVICHKLQAAHERLNTAG